MDCPRCHAQLPQVAHFCHVCGQDLRSADAARRRSFAARPDEPVASFALISSIMPRGSGQRPQTYRIALTIALAVALIAAIFGALADAGCNIDTIIQNEPLGKGRDAEVSFTVPAEDLPDAERALEPVIRELEIGRVDTVRRIGKVSIVGAGMRSNPGVSATFFKALANAGINIEMISTSEIRISVITRDDLLDEAVRAVHTAFDLDAGEVEAVVYGGTGR